MYGQNGLTAMIPVAMRTVRFENRWRILHVTEKHQLMQNVGLRELKPLQRKLGKSYISHVESMGLDVEMKIILRVVLITKYDISVVVTIVFFHFLGVSLGCCRCKPQCFFFLFFSTRRHFQVKVALNCQIWRKSSFSAELRSTKWSSTGR